MAGKIYIWVTFMTTGLTCKSKYDSEVIIDSERARQDAPELFGNGRLGISTLGMLSPFSEGASTISHSISLEIGDTREVEEDYWLALED